jgi:hypothetical protein
MTTAGHILTGLSLGVLVMPRRWRWPAKAAVLLAFCVLADAPDLKFPGWGHYKYHVSHSLLMNGLVLGVPALALGLWPAARRRVGGALVVLAGFAGRPRERPRIGGRLKWPPVVAYHVLR